MKIKYLQPEYVVTFPDKLNEGILYISEEYESVAHLCCCGCGEEVMTPLKPSKWRLSKSKSGVSLYPSIGNWKFDCQSHYWIKNNQVIEDGKMSKQRIEAVIARDKADNRRYIAQKNETAEKEMEDLAIPISSKKVDSSVLSKIINWFHKWFD